MGRGFYVHLSDPRIVYADEGAQMRQDNAERNHRQPGLGLPPEQDEGIVFQRRGCRCELAGWVWCCVYGYRKPKWNRYREYGFVGTADIDDWVDVKSTKSDDENLLVNEAGLQLEWAYLMVSPEQHPYYWIAGWCWGQEVVERSFRKLEPRSEREGYGYLVKPGRLRSPIELQHEMCRRLGRVEI